MQLGTSDPAELASSIGKPALKRPTRAADTIDGLPKRKSYSAAEVEEIHRPGKFAFPPTPRPAGPTLKNSSSPVLDRMRVEECVDFFRSQEPGKAPDYWFKNRFNACHGRTLVAEVFEGGLKVGAVQVDTVFIVSMTENARSAAVRVWFGNWWRSGKAPVGKPWTFGTACWDVDPSGPECNPDTISFTDTDAGWATTPERSQIIPFPTGGSTLPDDPSPAEERRFYAFVPYYYVPAVGGEQFYKLPDLTLRCDFARTVVGTGYARGSDCVFHQQAGIFQELSVSDPTVAESAQLIRDAFDDIGKTKPGKPDTWIPGKFGTPYPLDRLFYDDVARRTNRAAAIEECVKYFTDKYPDRNDPNEPEVKNDCDEYPFAVTHQGVQKTINDNTSRSYAVRPVHEKHNQLAGSLLGHWMADDHILEEDRFYVLIKD
ncbi:NucA/NucB deoxyribonuclease domain-containing protein [Lentzea sp. E54]|uniref:NucA/NucB deoxyribonuclease domain-containing protein n=1 Tax=Lentzea xerophila TaxID=3435883 RepID=UPI003DA1D6EA